MKMELTQDGFEKIEAKINELQGEATKGIQDHGATSAALKVVRCGLFDLKNLIRTVVVLNDPAA